MKRRVILIELLEDVKNGNIGEVDYHWDGKKVVKDNIIFTRNELMKWFASPCKQDGEPNDTEELQSETGG